MNWDEYCEDRASTPSVWGWLLFGGVLIAIAVLVVVLL